VVFGGEVSILSVEIPPLVITPAPQITTQPQGRTNTVGFVGIVHRGGDRSGNAHYQWRKNGVNIAGATSATYTISNVQNERRWNLHRRRQQCRRKRHQCECCFDGPVATGTSPHRDLWHGLVTGTALDAVDGKASQDAGREHLNRP
jgi:hypothetical protein